VFDVVGSLLMLVILSPLLLATVLAIKLSGRGPILFTQIRSGRDGNAFLLYKFRTMRATRTPDLKELVPLSHPDITRLGRWLRRTKIDELPQLFNVLSGEMSLIGPRPTLPDQVAQYDDFKRQRLLVRPGITGLAQVHGSTAIEWDERIRYDVYYVRHGSLKLDAWILWRTVPTILFGEQHVACSFDDSFAGVSPTRPKSRSR